jgi:hypothetical protein
MRIMVLAVRSYFFGDIMLCGPLTYNRSFGGIYRLCLQGLRISQAEKARSKKTDYTASYLCNHRLENLKSLWYSVVFSSPPYHMGSKEDRGCHVVSATDPYGRILGFLDERRYFLYQVALHLYSEGWVDPVQDPLLLRKSCRAVGPGIELGPLDL